MKLKTPRKTRLTSVRLTENQYQAIKLLKKQTGWSMANILSLALANLIMSEDANE
jgi:hypothetical protein